MATAPSRKSTPTSIVETLDLATVTVSSRIPEFWCDQPRLWFVQCEAILGPQKVSDETRYNLVVAKLGKDCIQQVSDILLKPPEAKKYEALKARLLTVYEESENRQFQKLLSEMELGDQKPSQILRRMRDLARGKISDDTLSIMWQGHLPPAVRAVLAVCKVKDLENLAAIADKVQETSTTVQVAEVQALSSSSDNTFILAEIAKLSLKMAELERGRPQFRRGSYNRRGSRSASRRRNLTRRTPECADWLYFYHHKYRERAVKCVEPCAWKNKSKQQEN